MPWRSLRLAGLSPDWTNVHVHMYALDQIPNPDYTNVHVHMYASDSVRTGFPQNRDEVASNWQVETVSEQSGLPWLGCRRLGRSPAAA